jgi:hypothetical protein
MRLMKPLILVMSGFFVWIHARQLRLPSGCAVIPAPHGVVVYQDGPQLGRNLFAYRAQ